MSQKSALKIYLSVLRFLLPYWKRIALVILLSALTSALSVIGVVLIGPIMTMLFKQNGASAMPLTMPLPGFVNDAFRSLIEAPTQRESLARLCYCVFGVFLLKNFVNYLSGLASNAIDNRVMREIREKVFNHLCSLSLDYFHRNQAGTLISRVMSDTGTLNGLLLPLFLAIVRRPLEAVGYLYAVLKISPWLTLIALVTSILSVILVRVLGKAIRRYSHRMQDSMWQLTNVVSEVFSSMRIVKAFATEKYEAGRFSEQTARFQRYARKHAAVDNLFGPINEIFAIAALVVVLWYGGLSVIEGHIEAGYLMTFLFSLFAMMSPITGMLGIPLQIQRGLPAAESVLGILEEAPSVKDGPRHVKTFSDALHFENVSFDYGAGEVLREVTLDVRRGETVALVGPSGAGKSTLADLAARFYDVTKGTILLDGVDVREFKTDDFRRLFGIVTQDPILFNDSIRNNIAYGIVEATMDDVERAARIANAHEFISVLAEGYDTMLGDRGVRLSGGQRQRIAIARAVLRNPEILIFDEATSALDSESEHLVQEAIERLLADRTAIVIAHRLSTIRNANRIVALENGRIAEQGKHDELLAHGGLYKRLHDMQFRTKESGFVESQAEWE